MRKKPVVAIDGPSGVGKSTVAKGLAKTLDFAYIDTGALYRTVALLADMSDVDWKDGEKLRDLANANKFAFDANGALFVNGNPVGQDIRKPRFSLGASTVSRHKEVREALLKLQRRLGETGGVVLEGRDIGTVVFPDAEIKIFLNASTRIRAKRRFLELRERGEDVTLEKVEIDQRNRDEADRNRPISPLRQAEDAVEIRCDDISANDVIDKITKYIQSQFSFDF